MSLTSPVSFVSDDFYFYRIYCFWIFYNCYQWTNNIQSMMSLMTVVLTPGPLVCAILLFALKIPLVVLITPLVELTIPLVVFVAWVIDLKKIVIESIGDVFLLVVFLLIGVESKGSRLIEIFWRPRS